MGYRPQAIPRPRDSKRVEEKYPEEKIISREYANETFDFLRELLLFAYQYRFTLFSLFLLTSVVLIDVATELPFTYPFREIRQKQLHLEHERETLVHEKEDYGNQRKLHDLQAKMAEYHSESGETLLDNGFYTDAEEAFTKALTLDKTNLQAEIGRIKAGILKRAISGEYDLTVIYQRLGIVLTHDPEDSHAHTMLGDLLTTIDPKAAELHYRRALTSDHKAAHARSGLAGMLIGRGDYQEARTLLEGAIALTPFRSLYHKNLAYVLTRMEDFQEAVTHYRYALSLDGKRILSHFELANALRMVGELEEAYSHCQNGVTLLERKEIADLPKNRVDWYFPTPYSRITYLTPPTMAESTVYLDRYDQKHVYGQLELAASELLLGWRKKASGRIRDLPNLPAEKRRAIEQLIARELQDVEKKQQHLVGNAKKFLNALNK
uniref:Tetratricopeptide repeat-containing protein n=1 Tax=Candidatus Kentrum sp. TUN TaxID=2126343 RepID=A0A450ZWK7_9GAMM|nr:MAG: Tetratricopeptide repeat-containing protein [Candidatus Kentron sp. TUN]